MMLSIRDEFYADVIVTTIENYGTGWFVVDKYDCGMDDESIDYVRMPSATIEHEWEEIFVQHTVNAKTFSPVFTKIQNKRRAERND